MYELKETDVSDYEKAGADRAVDLTAENKKLKARIGRLERRNQRLEDEIEQKDKLMSKYRRTFA